jgi:hypothetical protein
MTNNHNDWFLSSGMLKLKSYHSDLIRSELPESCKRICENFEKFSHKGLRKPQLDYGGLVINSLQSIRLKGKTLRVLRTRLLRKRAKLYNTTLPSYSSIVDYYYESVEKEGRYLPPLSVISQSSKSSFTPIISGTPKFVEEDPMRLLFLTSKNEEGNSR